MIKCLPEGRRRIKAVNNGVEADPTRFASTADGCDSG
jgi:hypothetical protein